MKILFSANKLWDVFIFRGGVIRALVDDGNDVKIIAPDDGRIDTKKVLRAEYIDVDVDKRGMNPLRDMKLFFQLLRIYRRERADLIFHYTIKLNIYGSIAAKFAGTKSIAVLTGLGYSFVNSGLVSKIAKALYKLALKFPEEVWVLNSDDKRYLADEEIVPESKIFILPGEGVNSEKYRYLPMERTDGKIVFLMIARAFNDKGFREYVAAAKKVLKKFTNVEFQFLGALGEESRAGVTKVEMDILVEEGILNYLGITDDVPSKIKEADCIVLPSYREGISMVLLEAAAMEKPIIATNVTGIREIVANNISGFLVQPKSADELAFAMEIFIKMKKEKRLEFGKKAREKVLSEFDEKLIIDIYRDKVEKYGA